MQTLCSNLQLLWNVILLHCQLFATSLDQTYILRLCRPTNSEFKVVENWECTSNETPCYCPCGNFYNLWELQSKLKCGSLTFMMMMMLQTLLEISPEEGDSSYPEEEILIRQQYTGFQPIVIFFFLFLSSCV